MGLLWVTIRVAVVSTSAALVIGLPIGLALGLGRFRGRRALQLLANASLALPPVVVGHRRAAAPAPAGRVRLAAHRVHAHARVYIAQTMLALPYIVALTPAAIQGLPPGLLDQARALGAGRVQLAAFALREAKIGVLAAVIAALGATISEVGRGGDRRRQHPGPRRDARERPARAVQLHRATTRTRSRSRSCCWR